MMPEGLRPPHHRKPTVDPKFGRIADGVEGVDEKMVLRVAIFLAAASPQ